MVLSCDGSPRNRLPDRVHGFAVEHPPHPFSNGLGDEEDSLQVPGNIRIECNHRSCGGVKDSLVELSCLLLL